MSTSLNSGSLMSDDEEIDTHGTHCMEDDHYYYFRNDSAEEGMSAGDPNLISGSTEQIADIALPDDSVARHGQFWSHCSARG